MLLNLFLASGMDPEYIPIFVGGILVGLFAFGVYIYLLFFKK